MNLEKLNPFKRQVTPYGATSIPAVNIKRIVVLANSRKRSGRCVAGKLIDSMEHPWIRPVSIRPDQEISRNELTLNDGTEPRPLDILDIPFQCHQPKNHQKENWLLAPRPRWNRVARVPWAELPSLLDNPGRLWTTGAHTHQGWHDRVSLSQSQILDCSLYFVHIEHLRLRVFTPGADYGKTERRVQGKFRYNDVYYRMWVTDPRIETAYSRKPDGEYNVHDCFLTVSLSEPLLGFCYKLVAGVIVQHGQNT